MYENIKCFFLRNVFVQHFQDFKTFCKTKGIHFDFDVTACKIRCKFPGKKLRIRAGNVNVTVKINKKRIDQFFPAVKFLNFIKKKIQFFPPEFSARDFTAADTVSKDFSHASVKDSKVSDKMHSSFTPFF